MRNLIRGSAFGILMNKSTEGRYFPHKKDLHDYILLEHYKFNYDEAKLFNSKISDISKISEELSIIVDWDNEDDSENPKNWSKTEGLIFGLQISLNTLTVYMGSSIYVPGIDSIQNEFNISNVVATIPLTLFIFGYGIGPMIFSPLSENAKIGRMPLYVSTLFMFTRFQIPTALSTNIISPCILRFLCDLLASPCLGNGAAAICDVFSVPYGLGISLRSIAATAGPSFGPLIGAALVVNGS